MDESNPGFWREVFEIYEKVADRPAPDRDSLLDRLTTDPSVRDEVRAMLADDGSYDGFLDIPAAYFFSELTDGFRGAPEVDPDETEVDRTHRGPFPPPGTRIGPYRVVRGLGIGGMGQVVLAERADGQFERSVALKLLPRKHTWQGADEAAVAERKVLAKLEHPGIARLFDAGTTEDGTPWFAMEYVDGMPIDAYVHERRLGVRETLELFLQVCDALQYAHERLIVHRDVKPSNLFVSRDGTVKLLDFGIAKQLATEEGERTTSGLMTPRFAAPEQVVRGVISTATDVYGLGMVLYEVLAGEPAYGSRTGTSYEWQERVLRHEPAAPSRACADPARARKLAGDIDAVLLKALRKKPEERYPTVAAFAADLRAHLDSRPVGAVKGSGWYNLRRFVRRHRRKVAAVASIAVAVFAGAIATLWQSQVAARERDRALTAEAEGRALHGFLVEELLSAATPEVARGDDLSVREVLDRASQSAGGAFRGQPRLEHSMRLTLARTYSSLGEFEAARHEALAALAAVDRMPDPDGRERHEANLELATIDLLDGRYDEARRRAESIRAALEGTPQETDPLFYRASMKIALTDAHLERGGAAESRLRPLMEEIDARFPEDDPLRVEVRETLTQALAEELKLAEAEAIQREVLELQRRRLDDEHPEYLASLRELGRIHFRQLRYADAESVHRRVLEARRRVFGERHPMTASSKHDLGFALRRLDRYEESQALVREAYDDYTATLGTRHPKTLSVMRALAIDAKFEGDYDRAESLFSLALEATREIYGELNRHTLVAMRDLYLVAHQRGDAAGAESRGRALIDAYRRAAESDEVTPYVLHDFADFLLDVPTRSLRDPARALEIATRAVELSEGKLYKPLMMRGYALERLERTEEAAVAYREALALPEGVQSWSTERRLAALYREQGRPEDAEALLLEMHERRLRERGPDDDLAAQSLQVLGEMYFDQKRYADAEREFRRAAEQFARAVLPSDWRSAWNRSCLGEAIAAQGRHAEAEPHLLEGFRLLDEDSETRMRTLEAARTRLVDLYEAWGRRGDAEDWRTRVLDGR